MAVFNPFDPLKNVTPRFTEEQLSEIIEFFDERAKPLLVIDNGEPINSKDIHSWTKVCLRDIHGGRNCATRIQRLPGSARARAVPGVEVFCCSQLFTRYIIDAIIFHRRHFSYPTYKEIMTEAEYLKAGVTRLLTKEQVIYILDKRVIEPEIKHELLLAFQMFDTENRNFLELGELEVIVTTYADAFNAEETREILRDANVRGDGNIVYENFVESLFGMAPELYDIKVDFLYPDPDEDPSVPPLPPEPEPEPEPEPVPETPQEEVPAPPPPPPPPPPAPAKPAKGKKK